MMEPNVYYRTPAVLVNQSWIKKFFKYIYASLKKIFKKKKNNGKSICQKPQEKSPTSKEIQKTIYKKAIGGQRSYDEAYRSFKSPTSWDEWASEKTHSTTFSI